LPRWRFVGPLALVGVACSDKETADSRQDFENKTQRQLDKIDKRMNELENQVKSSNADDDAKRELVVPQGRARAGHGEAKAGA
jgi:hypothetical protein